MNSIIQGSILKATVKTIILESKLHEVIKQRDLLFFMLDSCTCEEEENLINKLLIDTHREMKDTIGFIDELELISEGEISQLKFCIN